MQNNPKIIEYTVNDGSLQRQSRKRYPTRPNLLTNESDLNVPNNNNNISNPVFDRNLRQSPTANDCMSAFPPEAPDRRFTFPPEIFSNFQQSPIGNDLKRAFPPESAQNYGNVQETPPDDIAEQNRTTIGDSSSSVTFQRLSDSRSHSAQMFASELADRLKVLNDSSNVKPDSESDKQSSSPIVQNFTYQHTQRTPSDSSKFPALRDSSPQVEPTSPNEKKKYTTLSKDHHIVKTDLSTPLASRSQAAKPLKENKKSASPITRRGSQAHSPIISSASPLPEVKKNKNKEPQNKDIQHVIDLPTTYFNDLPKPLPDDKSSETPHFNDFPKPLEDDEPQDDAKETSDKDSEQKKKTTHAVTHVWNSPVPSLQSDKEGSDDGFNELRKHAKEERIRMRMLERGITDERVNFVTEATIAALYGPTPEGSEDADYKSSGELAKNPLTFEIHEAPGESGSGTPGSAPEIPTPS